MDTVQEWAQRLAESAVPEEVDLAPAIADAFVRGGSARKQLFAVTKGQLGGFSAESVFTLFPYILAGISAASSTLISILTSTNLESSLGIVHYTLGIFAERKSAAEGAAALGAGALLFKRHHGHSERDKNTHETPEKAPIALVAEKISAELVAQGVKQDKADAVAFRVLLKLLESPESAVDFVTQVAAKS